VLTFHYFKKEYEFAQESRYEIPALTTFSDVFGNQMLRSLEFSWRQTGTIYGEVGTEYDYNIEKEKLMNSIEKGENLAIEGIVDLEGDSEALIQIEKNNSNKNNSIRYNKYNYKEETLSDFGYQVKEREELTISESNAKEIVDGILMKLDIDYVSLVEYKIENKRHCFEFCRSINGLTQNTIVPENYNPFDAYRERWGEEQIYFEIDNTGLAKFVWQSPSDLVEELTESVTMLDFNEIVNGFLEQIAIKKTYISNEDAEYIIKREFYIDSIELSNMTIAKLNNQDEYYAAPVWDFFGYGIITYSDEYSEYVKANGGYKLDEKNQRIIKNDEISYLTINALDGSIIDRSLGY
jgi:hypothetical protein